MVTVLPLLAALPPVFDLTQAAAVGLSRHVLPRAVRDGVVVRIAGGLFAASERWSAADRRERHLLQCAAAARQRPWATISHHSAACRHGLPLPRHLPPWVAMSTGRALTTANPGGLVRLEPGALPAGHVSQLHGIRLTTPARTVIDCLRCLGLADGVAMADAALRAGMTTGDELVGMRRDQRRWPNITQADLGLTLLDPARENWLESTAFVGLWARGIPLPESQVSVFTVNGTFVGRLDALWRARALALEIDGRGKYLGEFDDKPVSGEEAARAVLAEKFREDRVRGTGLTVVRADSAEIEHDIDVVVVRIAEAWEAAQPARFRGHLRSHASARITPDAPGPPPPTAFPAHLLR